MVEAIIQENDKQKALFENALKSSVFKDLTVKIGKVALDDDAIKHLQTQVKNALLAVGFDLDEQKAKKAGEKAGKATAQGFKNTVVAGYKEAADEMKTQFEGVEDIRGYFKNQGYQKVKIGKVFDVDGIKQYNVELKKVENGWETVDRATVGIKSKTEHIIGAYRSTSREVDAIVKKTVDVNNLNKQWLVSIDKLKVVNKAAFDVTDVKSKLGELTTAMKEAVGDPTQEKLDKVTLGFKKLDLEITKANQSLKKSVNDLNKEWGVKIDKLQARNADAFKVPEVTKELSALNAAMTQAVGSPTQENIRKVGIAFQTLDIAIIKAKANMKAMSSQTKDMTDLAFAWEKKLTDWQTQHTRAFENKDVQEQLARVRSAMNNAFGNPIQANIKKVSQEMSTLDSAIKKVNSTQRVTYDNTKKWTEIFKSALDKVVLWFGATTLFYGSIRQFGEMTQYVKDLNKELTNIQIVTGVSAGSIRSLAKDFNDLAQEMGATTLQVAQASTEWFRQGKTVEETEKLLRSTLMLSKLGNLDSAQATEYLTSTLNGFKLEAEDAITVVDKLISLDNAYATSAGELAEALQRTANSAQQAGFTFDEIVSYITVVSSVSRKSADSIGF